MPKIYFATDHAGFHHKESVRQFVQDELGYEVFDFGAYSYDEFDDYPPLIAAAAKRISAEPHNRAIIFGGSGQGEAMVANRYENVRATVFYGHEPSIITLSREHNNANILSIGARFVTTSEANEVVRRWLETAFTAEERHLRRINLIEQLH